MTLSGTAAHKSISFNKSKDSDFTSVPVYSLGFKQDLRPGDRIEVKASAKGYPSVKAETVVPEPIRIVSAEIVEKEGSFITLEIVYEEDDDEDGYYGIVFNDHNISEAPGFTMAESFDMIIYIMALISINVGVFNLLPIPALDGGRVFFVLVEAIRRKPIKPEHEGYVHFAGMVLLLLLMAVITMKDIIKLF